MPANPPQSHVSNELPQSVFNGLQKFSTQLQALTDFTVLLEYTTQSVARLTESTGASAWFFNRAHVVLEPTAWYGTNVPEQLTQATPELLGRSHNFAALKAPALLATQFASTTPTWLIPLRHGQSIVGFLALTGSTNESLIKQLGGMVGSQVSLALTSIGHANRAGQLENERRTLQADLQHLYQVLGQFTSVMSEHEVAEAIPALACHTLQYDFAAYYAWGRSTYTLVGAAATGSQAASFKHAAATWDVTALPGTAAATDQAQPVTVSDVTTDPHIEDRFIKTHLQHYALVPISGDDGSCGILFVGRRREALPFNDTKLEQLALYSRICANALRTARHVAEQYALSRRQSEFVSIASHELRTPITALIGFLSLARGSVKIDETQRQRFLQRAEAAAARLSELVEDLLNVARIEEGRLVFNVETLQPGRLLEEVVESCHTIADKKGLPISFDNQLTAADRIEADRSKLAQVFSNLIENAIKYTPPGGHIQVLTRRGENDTIRVTVTDDGIGIHADNLNRIFEKFFREYTELSIAAGGTGLGLFITKELVERQQGRLEISSIKERGTTATVTFGRVTAT